MQVSLRRITALLITSALVLVGFGALSSPAQAKDKCDYPVDDQTANDHPLDTIRLVSPVLTDENSVHRTDFEEEFTILCDWFGVGTRFNQVYVPFGMTTTLTYLVTDSKGAPMPFTQLKLRANKGYSSSNAHIYVNGTSIRPNTGGPSDGGIVKATTDVNGYVSFVVKSPTDCEEYGGKLNPRPLHLNSDTPHDTTTKASEDCYSQIIPQVISETVTHTEKTDTVDFVELHYFDPLPYVAESPVVATVPKLFPTVVVPVQTPIISSGTVTIKTSSPHGLSVGDSVTLGGVSPVGYQGTYQVTAIPTATTFSYSNSTTGNITLAGTMQLQRQQGVGNGANVTFTTTVPHLLSVGDYVTIDNVSPAGYRGTYEVTAVPSPTTFTYENSTTGVITTDGTVQRSPGNGTTATLSTTSAHKFRVGQSVIVDSVEPAGYSGTYTISAVTATTFSFENATTGAIAVGGHAMLVGKDRVTGEDPVTEAQLTMAVPYLDEENSIVGESAIQAYVTIGSKQTIVVQATQRDEYSSWARNIPVKVRINLADSGSNAKVSAGLYGDAYRGFNSPAYKVNSLATTAANLTKTTEDQLVLTGTTDAFGTVVFALNNSDTVGERAPASAISPVPTDASAKYSRITATSEGVSSNDPVFEAHYFKPAPVLPTSITATASGRTIKVTIKNAIGKTSTITITGRSKVTVKPTIATKVLSYTVKKGKITVKVVSNGKTLTKVFTIK